MPGMGGSPIELTNPLVVALFRHSLLITSAFWILGVGLIILITALASRRVFAFNLSPRGLDEPRSRTYLRWMFGSLWLFAGALQFQPSMPLGLANDVVAPASNGVPAWLHAVVFTGIGIWNNHPVALAVATAWIQVGIGVALLVSNATVGRVAAALSVVWASMVWLVGNGAGGIFSTVNSILFGWPGASLFYVVAGVWLALDQRRFARHFARFTNRGLSVLLVGATVIQALPSRGFWRGGNDNALTRMSAYMTRTPQPHWLAWITVKGGVIAGTMGGGFNLLVIFWLLVCAVGLWFAGARGWRWPTRTLVIGCTIFWVLAQDAAIFGGLATDLNSLVPLAALAWCADPRERAATPRTGRLPHEMRSASGAVAAAFASAMILFSLGAVIAAAASPSENTFYLARNGSASQVRGVAPKFTLVDQSGASYTVGEHTGRFTLLTFLDPRCYTDCPLLADQLRVVRSSLAPDAKIDVVAVAADPYHETRSDVRRFIARHGLGSVRDFYFVTSPDRSAMKRIWAQYGISVTMRSTDRMSVHSDTVFIIDPSGQIRWVVPDDPLASWSGQRSAVAELMTLLHSAGLK